MDDKKMAHESGGSRAIKNNSNAQNLYEKPTNTEANCQGDFTDAAMVALKTKKVLTPEEIKQRCEAKAEKEQAEYALEPSEAVQFSSKEILKALNSNEDGDAWLFIETFRGRFCYDYAAGRWHIWAGHYWDEDHIEQATANIQAVIEVYGQEAQRQAWERLKLEKAGQTDKAKEHKSKEDELLKRIRTLQSAKRKKDVLHLAKVGRGSLAITGEEWDVDPWRIGCKNGVINLKTGEHRPGKPDDYIKTVTSVEWQGLDTSCPAWKRFLSEIFDKDDEIVNYLQRLLGYGITGKTSHHIHPILWGRGRNGKGTLLEILKYVLGELAYKTKSELLLDQKFNNQSSAPNPDIMALRGKRIVWASETNEGRKLNASKLKELCGGDTLNARALYSNHSVEFQPTHLLLLLTNYKPHAPANDFALWQRLHLIPFEMSFVEEPEPQKDNQRQADSDLPDDLKSEAPGILAWLVRGCLEWQKHGLKPPEKIKAATKEYQQAEDIIGQFIQEQCLEKENMLVKAGQLRKAYETWCDENGFNTISAQKFAKAMLERFDRDDSGRHRTYIGVGLKVEN